jgi:putative tryptophan/tyrosine transport system substrate-binding protein
MQRREFITRLGGAAVAALLSRPGLGPPDAYAQQSPSRIPVVGVLWHAASAEEEEVYLSVLRKAFRDLGYIEGKNIQLEHRFPAENPNRFRTLARELVDSKVDAVIAVTTLGAVELKKLTSTIPIVFAIVADPVGFGLVQSLARPGGNATGLSLMTIDLSGKRLGLLKEAVPNLSRVALLVDPTDPFRQRTFKANQVAAETLGLSIWPVEIAAPDDVEPAFAKITQDRADGVVFGAGSLLFNLRARIGAAALAHRLPALAYIAEEVPSGLLMSYGQDLPDYFRRAAGYIDKIVKGAKPADLPVEQPTKFKLLLNLKTANALGVKLSDNLLSLADEVIEQ